MDPGGDRQLPSGVAGVPPGGNGSDGSGNDNTGDVHCAFISMENAVVAERHNTVVDQRASSGVAGVVSGVNDNQDSSNVLLPDGSLSALTAVTGAADAPGGSGCDQLSPSGVAGVAPSPNGHVRCANEPQSVPAPAESFSPASVSDNGQNAHARGSSVASGSGGPVLDPVATPAEHTLGPPDSPTLRPSTRSERPPDEGGRHDQRSPRGVSPRRSSGQCSPPAHRQPVGAATDARPEGLRDPLPGEPLPWKRWTVSGPQLQHPYPDPSPGLRGQDAVENPVLGAFTRFLAGRHAPPSAPRSPVADEQFARAAGLFPRVPWLSLADFAFLTRRGGRVEPLPPAVHLGVALPVWCTGVVPNPDVIIAGASLRFTVSIPCSTLAAGLQSAQWSESSASAVHGHLAHSGSFGIKSLVDLPAVLAPRSPDQRLLRGIHPAQVTPKAAPSSTNQRAAQSASQLAALSWPLLVLQPVQRRRRGPLLLGNLGPRPRP